MLKKLITLLLVVSTLSGCFGAYERVDSRLKDDTTRMQEFEKAQTEQKKPEPAVKITPDVYLGRGIGTKIPDSDSLPEVFSKTITFISQPQPLEEVLVKVSKITGLPVGYFDPTQIETTSSTANSPRSSQSSTTPGFAPPASPVPPNPFVSSTQTSSAASQAGSTASGVVLSSISYKGSIKGLFDQISTAFGGSWEYRESSVFFYKMKTKTFQLNAFSGSISTTSALSVSGTSTGSTVATNLEERREIWKDVLANVKGMLSASGRVTDNQSSGTITVTDSPYAIYVVEDYLEEINKRLSKQVAVSVEVYSLKLNDDAGSRFSMDVVVNDIANKYTMAMTGYAPALNFTNFGQMLTTIVDPLPVSNRPSFDGSKAIVQALATQGQLSLSRSVTGITMNNQPMPIQSTRNQTYISKLTTTTTSDTKSISNSVETSILSTGIVMTVTPTILENNQILLHYIISLTELNALNKDIIDVDDGTFIQRPDVNSSSLVQRVALKSGSTLILAGIRKSDATDGTGSGFLAYSKNASKSSEAIVFVLTASIVAGVE